MSDRDMNKLVFALIITGLLVFSIVLGNVISSEIEYKIKRVREKSQMQKLIDTLKSQSDELEVEIQGMKDIPPWSPPES